MRRNFALLLLLLSLIAQPILAKDSCDLLLQDKQLLITLGNSITQAGEKPEGYVSLMRKILDDLYPEQTVYIVNAGISGHKSTDMSERFERDVLQYSPDWVTISVGVNDVWHGFYDHHPKGDGPRGVPLPLFREKVIDMVARAQASGIRVALFTTTVIKEDLSSPENTKLVVYNKALRQIASKYNCLLVDMDKAFRRALEPYQKPGMKDRGILTSDGVHMLPPGNWLMAKTVLAAFGVPEKRIEMIRPRIKELVAEEKKALAKSLARYAECNYEVGMPRRNEKRLVFYGSSSVDLWNLARDFPHLPFLNRGIGGETTRQMVFRFRQDVIGLKPYAAIIFFGSCNDFWPKHKMPVAETKSNIIKMARAAKGAGIKLAFGAVSPVNDYLPGRDIVATHPIEKVQQLNDWIKDFCQQNGLVYVDFYSPVADSTGKLAKEFTNDGMHCNATGYAKWKPIVVRALKELGAWKD